MDIYKPTYDDIHNGCLRFTDVFRRLEFDFDVIVGITRGGLIPGVILSHMMNLPFRPINYSSRKGAGDYKLYSNDIPQIDGNIVLLVDEICDTGHTLKEVKTLLEQQGKSVYTCCLYYKQQDVPVIVPDFRLNTIPKDAPWVIFPYEVNYEL